MEIIEKLRIGRECAETEFLKAMETLEEENEKIVAQIETNSDLLKELFVEFESLKAMYLTRCVEQARVANLRKQVVAPEPAVKWRRQTKQWETNQAGNENTESTAHVSTVSGWKTDNSQAQGPHTVTEEDAFQPAWTRRQQEVPQVTHAYTPYERSAPAHETRQYERSHATPYESETQLYGRSHKTPFLDTRQYERSHATPYESETQPYAQSHAAHHVQETKQAPYEPETRPYERTHEYRYEPETRQYDRSHATPYEPETKPYEKLDVSRSHGGQYEETRRYDRSHGGQYEETRRYEKAPAMQYEEPKQYERSHAAPYEETRPFERSSAVPHEQETPYEHQRGYLPSHSERDDYGSLPVHIQARLGRKIPPPPSRSVPREAPTSF